MTFKNVLEHSVNAYLNNIKLISIFAIPLIITLPLSLSLPNFISLGGVFLRFGSIGHDFTTFDLIITGIAFLISLLVISFALVAINMLVKSQRSMVKPSYYDIEKIWQNTLNLFIVFLIAFLIILGFNIVLYDYGLNQSLGLIISLLVSIIIIFAPQAIVIDGLDVKHIFIMSVSTVAKKFWYFIGFLVIASLLMMLNSALFISLLPSLSDAMLANYLAVIVNAMIIIPFLEVFKIQIYLSKYSIL